MCGIYITNIDYCTEEVNNKLAKIEYRGPDFRKIIKTSEITLGHLRLAILDLDSRSNQPYQFKDYTIVFNGEIYNYKSIQSELLDEGYTFETKSDTEVLIKAYDCWGGEMLEKLNGMFAFAIYNELKDEVFCARDRLGVKPFYYYWSEGKFEICSQLQPLIKKTSSISKEAISIYLDCGYIPSPYSILENVKKLEPGNYLKINLKSGEKEIHSYWDLKKAKIDNISFDKAKEKLKSLLIDAVKIRMQSDVKIGTFLSGGIDSALVTAIASEISEEKINTFTIGFNNSKFDESKIAEKFAEILGTNHKTTICSVDDVLKLLPKFIEVYDEPFADSSALPSLLLNKKTKENVTVAISGDGGDESFLGYNHFSTIEKFNKLKTLPFSLRKQIAKLPVPKKIKSILNLESKFDFIERIFLGDSELSMVKKRNWINKYYSNYRTSSDADLQQIADLNIKLWLENDSNVKVDRASMAYSVEVRSPFLDYRIIEFARTLPEVYKYKKDNRKIILKDILEDYIPKEVFNRPKSGFSIPLANWIRKELKDEVLKTLDDKKLKDLGLINFENYKQMIKDHMNNQHNYASNIWKVYILHLWLNRFYKLKDELK